MRSKLNYFMDRELVSHWLNNYMTDIQKIDKYLAEASAMTVKMGKKHTDAVMALRNIISEIGFVNADSNLGWDSEIQKANKIIDLADGSIAKLLMKYNRATV